MKRAFVCYVEHSEKEGDDTTCFAMASGNAAESYEAFIDYWRAAGARVSIVSWFKVPENWKNAVSNGTMNDAFHAVLGLDALSDTPVVSDLLTTIFAAGFHGGMEHAKEVMLRFGDFNAEVMTELAKVQPTIK